MSLSGFRLLHHHPHHLFMMPIVNIFNNHSVSNPDDPVRPAGNVIVVGDDDHRFPQFSLRFTEHFYHVIPGFFVKIPSSSTSSLI